MLHDEAGILDAGLAAHALKVGLPALAVGRVGEHEVELAGGEGVRRESGAIVDVVGLAPLSLEDQVGLADGVGLWIDLLAVQVDRHFLIMLISQPRQSLLGNRQHPACAASAVVDQVSAGPDLISDGQEDEARHELHHVPRE